MEFRFRNFAELAEVIGRMTEEEKKQPVALADNDVNLKTLGTISFATEDWPCFESGDLLPEGATYLW